MPRRNENANPVCQCGHARYGHYRLNRTRRWSFCRKNSRQGLNPERCTCRHYKTR